MTPTYKIHGNERRMLKVILYGMKNYLKWLTYEQDKTKQEIQQLETKLNEKYDNRRTETKIHK
jgi:hypothetical protein